MTLDNGTIVFHYGAGNVHLSPVVGIGRGHSGGVELVLTILALQRGVIPPTINYQTPDPDCDLDYTPNQARERKIDVALSNSFGFGGHNASLLVGHLRNGKAS